FYPRFLTAIMSALVTAGRTAPGWSRFGALTEAARDSALAACRAVTDSIYPGLDLTEEIRAVHDQVLGDTVLVEGDGGIVAFGICHHGPRSEAGADTCFVKFGAVRGNPAADGDYARLIDACEAFAAEVGMAKLLAGVNLARREAYEHLA